MKQFLIVLPNGTGYSLFASRMHIPPMGLVQLISHEEKIVAVIPNTCVVMEVDNSMKRFFGPDDIDIPKPPAFPEPRIE